MPGYVMSADEVTFWQDQAALLDPLAYTFKHGTSQTVTVGAGKRLYVVGAWLMQPINGGDSWFHRRTDIENAIPIAAGVTLTTDATNAASYLYYCDPSVVADPLGAHYDSRYTDDPRALFFDRYMRSMELTTFDCGADVGGGSHTNAWGTFPTDFTYGLALQSAQHDISWVALEHSSTSLAMAILDENGDNNVSRFTARTLFPFDRTVFPKVKILGASAGVDPGRGNLIYVKIPSGW